MFFRQLWVIILVLLFWVILPGGKAGATGLLRFVTVTETVTMGLNANGYTLDFIGEVSEGCQVYLKVTGPVRRAVLSPAGKSFSWIDVETVKIDGLPGFFQVIGTDSFANLPAALQQKLGIGSGYDSLFRRAKVTIREEEKERVLPQAQAYPYLANLVQLREREGLYRCDDKGIRLHGTSFSGSLFFPPEVPRGEFRLEAYAIRDGKVVGFTSRKLVIKGGGLVQVISKAAQYQPDLYGLGAVMLALAAGFSLGQLCKELNKLVGGQGGISPRQ